MRKRTIVGTGAAAILTAGAVLVPLMGSAQAAPAAPATHTISFTSVALKGGELDGASSDIFADKDINAQGKTVGFDTLYVTYNAKTKMFTGVYTVQLPHGVIYIKGGGIASTGALTGKITGGAGDYKNAKGTLVAQRLDKVGATNAVSIKFTA